MVIPLILLSYVISNIIIFTMYLISLLQLHYYYHYYHYFIAVRSATTNFCYFFLLLILFIYLFIYLLLLFCLSSVLFNPNLGGGGIGGNFTFLLVFP